MRKVFLDELPRKGRHIHWENSINKKIKFTYDDISGEMEIIDYIKPSGVVVRFNGKELKIHSSSLASCQLGGLLDKKTNSFKIEVNQILKDNKRNLKIIKREYREKERKRRHIVYIEKEKWYMYKCIDCEYEGWMIEGSLNRGYGCPCCSNRITILGFNTIWDTNRWMVDLGVSEEDAKRYASQSNKKIKVICPDCGVERMKSISNIYNNKSISCLCGDGVSYPEKIISSILSQLGVKFKSQYSPKYLIRLENNKKSRKYSDFYLPDHNLIIEADGGLNHKGGKTYSKSQKTLEEYIKIDKWKDEQHLKHDIKTIRIDCLESNIEYIKNSIINSKLNKLFDLSTINWLRCEEFALSNLVKKVCEYWNNKEEWETTTTIAKNNPWGIKSDSTIRNYLKRGTKLGLTDYSAKEESIKMYRKNSGKLKHKCSKPVEIFKDGASLGVFESCTELSRKSEELFGVKLLHGGVSSVCIGAYKQYKGFTFKYIEEDNNQIAS